MRSGGYTLHHSLTVDAAGVVKQAVSLARRRGHAQVSPLHVASAMLASPAGLLKRACLQSHSHPLQCKALELCFNVALNRLPTSASAPLLGPHSHHHHHHHLPSLSNALVAAFKRAQAHQRRGSIENQQQSILALKVEVEQLVVSILDDPSVSRVMREAGFSSAQVKSNVEHAVSVEKSAASQPPSKESFTIVAAKTLLPAPSPPPPPSMNLSQFRHNKAVQNYDDDVMTVLEAMSGKKTRNTVIVGESAAAGENLVKKVMEKFDGKDADVPHDMKAVQFVSVPLSTLRSVSKEEFEVKLAELRSLVKSYVGRGVVLYLGDLDWVSAFWCKCSEEQRNVFYSPVEYMIMELSRLVCGGGESYKRLWLMGIATFQTYSQCRSGRPSLESLWSLHPLKLETLALGLSLHSGMHDQVKKEEPLEDCNWLLGIKNSKQLVCCWDCADSFKKEAEVVMNCENELVSSSSASRLPSWLQQYKDEKRKQLISINDQLESDKIKDLCKKWNSICSSVHKKPHFLEKTLNLSSSSSPSSSASTSSSDRNKSKIRRNLLNGPVILDRDGEVSKPSAKPELLSNPNSSPNSASSSEASEEDMKLPHEFEEFNSENVRILTEALEKKVPCQKHVVSDIITPILKCRSGAKMRSESSGRRGRESWLAFMGPDHHGKETMAREVARLVFGSRDDFVAVGISSFSSGGGVAEEEVASKKKRARDEHGGSAYDRFAEAVRDNPSRLFYVEDVDGIEECGCLRGFERAVRDGGVLVGGEFSPLKDAIVVFSCDRSRAPSAPLVDDGKREKDGEGEEEEKEERRPLDLNVATEDRDSVSGIRILDSVDMQVVFRIQVL